ncbi:non-ribosomal peptide synthetase [Nocardia arizonensis]|uniref:non-ribosomal peptide synthetase n=1 Tax=Nocardia arizonensis TaxID=1141647 RepID=UPI0006D11EE2|nr:non-ribosomal peptide synthetase [Nocardia arizonensis]
MKTERPDLAALTSQEKRALLERLVRERAERAAERELSPGERGLWFHYRLAPDSASYNILYAGTVRGPLDLARLESALAALVARHEVLGSTFRESDGVPVAVSHPNAVVPLHTVDGTTWHSNKLQTWLDTALDKPIDLVNGPVLQATVIRRSDDEHVIALAMAHIVIDFWSLDLLLTELSALYEDPAARLPAIPHRFGDYVRWQTRLLGSERGETLWNYWKQQLAGDLPQLELPGKRPRPAIQTFNGATHRFDVDADLTAALRELARDEGVTTQVAVLSAFFAVLHRYSGLDDILVGSPIAGRGMPGSEGIIGYFVNSVVLRAELADNPTYRALMQRSRRTVLDAIEHQDFPFALLAERLQPVRDPAFPPVFQVFFAWETSRLSVSSATSDSRPDGLAFESATLAQGGAPVDLMLIVAEREHILSAVLQYNSDLFDADTIAGFAQGLITFMTHAVVSPAAQVGRIPLLTEREIRERARWNDTRVDAFTGHRLYDLVLAQMRRTPEATAVTYRGNHLSYGELHRRVDDLAARLHAAGARPGGVVGIAIERSEWTIVSAVAVLAAGCAFLPVDPKHPRERLQSINGDATPVVWITESGLRDRLPDEVPVLCLDRPHATVEGPVISGADRVGPDDIAYVIFTSGTTGAPKGARNTHRGICNRLLWMQDAYRLTAADTVLHKTPANFDVSVWEIFWPLVAGARVVVAEPERHRDSGYLVETIVDQEVTVAHFVPSMLRAFLADPAAGRCTGLREVITSGEALAADLRDILFATLPANLHNLYGPTEAAIDVTFFDCARGDRDPVIPIGKPIANTQIHLLDRDMNPVPVGVIGELYIGGINVAEGYANRPELTAERFVTGPHPGGDPAYPSGPLYRTGDRARYRPDGNIEYLGRGDNQVKIRGVRIELGEVEGALAASPAVREAAVVVRDGDTDTLRLVAYVVAVDPSAPPSTADLREFLRDSLPDAMLPAQFVVLDGIPTTPTGKRDDRALPEPDSARPDISADYVAPRTDTERAIAGLWQQVLGLDTVGVFDDFFELGGASTQTMSICAAARDIGLSLTPEVVFRHRTVAGIAASIVPGETPLADAPIEQVATSAPTVASSAPVREPVVTTGTTVIESIGVYLPDTVVPTADVLTGCDRPVELPLEQLTGIKNRRIAGQEEFTLDLARKAAENCLAKSGHDAASIDLLICTNISKVEGPDNRLVFEPSTSSQLRALLGMTDALSFDLSNACAGMFTGITVADAFLATNLVRTAMVVSGEYISHIIDTAQREITDFLDDRLACLTVGDAGAAIILERDPTGRAGFHDLRLRSLSRYSDLCIGKATDQPHGGAIMRTKAVEQTAVAVRKSVPFATQMLERYGWQPETVDHILMHQTSQASINDAVATINRTFGRTVSTPDNTVSNLEQRGNTASTTHFVAINDLVEQDRLRPGDRMLFGVTGSGQTIGAALYTFDDLPDRLRNGRPAVSRPNGNGNGNGSESEYGRRSDRKPTVRVDAVAVAVPTGEEKALDLAVRAAGACIDESSIPREDIGLVLYAGVFRDDCIVEPAMAAFVADELKINDDPAQPFDHGTFVFDVRDGNVGFLKACHIAATGIDAGKARSALVVAAEADPEHPSRAAELRGVRHTGSAVLLSAAQDGVGFGGFHFAAFPAYLDAVTSFAGGGNGNHIEFDQRPDIEDIYLGFIPEVVAELLKSESLALSDMKVILAPQISTEFLGNLAERIGVAGEQIIDVTDGGPDLYTSSLPAALRYCREGGRVTSGDIGLVITVGAGVQIGCAIYHF